MACEGRGLKLVEAMAIIGVLGVVLAILAPVVNAAREAARRSECASNLKELALALNNDASADPRGMSTLIGASSGHPGGVNGAFMDGSVKFITNGIGYLAWCAIATPDGGEIVGGCSCQ